MNIVSYMGYSGWVARPTVGVLLQVLEGAGRADESTGRGQRLRRHSQAAHDRQTAAGRRQEQEEVRPGSQACL